MKFEDFKKILDVAKMGMDAVVSVSDWRARRRIERRKALDDEKDKRIKELEKELAALKGKKNELAVASASDTERPGELHAGDDDEDDSAEGGCESDGESDADEE